MNVKKIKSRVTLTIMSCIWISLLSCSPEENPREDNPRAFYGVVLKDQCNTTAEGHTRYCVTKETYEHFENNKPEYCARVSFKTKSGNMVGGIYSGISFGTSEIPCEN